ncbi:MAG: hypothetical protein VW405_02390, partial [Rhodospirillaceae bacterium]
YEDVRRGYLAEVPFPKRIPVAEKPVEPRSEMGKRLGLTEKAIVKVYDPEDGHENRSAEWLAGLGFRLAARCLKVELKRGDTPLTEPERVAFYKAAMSNGQAVELAMECAGLLSLQAQRAADFTEGPSEPGGE